MGCTMRARALLFGGLLASLFVPIQGAEALIANVTIDPITRQPLVVQPQPSAPYGGQTGSSVGQSYRYQPGGRGYGAPAAYGSQSYGAPAAYGTQSYGAPAAYGSQSY